MDMKQKKGVRKGYNHHWKYTGRWDETKTGPGMWSISFKATKRKKSGLGGPKPGTRIVWKIDGYQTAIKTKKGEYQTHLKGTKKLVKIKYR